MLGDKEDDGTKPGRDSRSNTPSSKDLGDTPEGPVYTLGTSRSNTNPNDTSHDGVGSRYRHGELSSNCEVRGRSNNSARHSKHQNRRVIFEELCGNDLGADGVCDARTDEHGTRKLHDGGDAHGLLESKGT